VSEAESVTTRIGWWRCNGGAFAHLTKVATDGVSIIGIVHDCGRQLKHRWSLTGQLLNGTATYSTGHAFTLTEYLGTEHPRMPVIEVHEMRPEPEPPEPVHKYHRKITHTLERGAIVETGDRVTITVDVYDVLKAFDVRCPAIQHAIKKLLCAGIRGHKDRRQDLSEARASIGRAIELEVVNGKV
jgi:hypothetical protein